MNMEKNFRFGFHQQLHLSSPILNSSHFPIDTGCPNAGLLFMNPNSAEVSTPRTAPSFPVSQFQQSRVSDPNFYQTFGPALNTASKENVPTGGLFDFGQHRGLTTTPTAHNQKRFLVFDQSGNKTTLMYSSGVQTLAEYGANWTMHPPTDYVLSKDPLSSIHPSRANTADEYTEYNSRDVTGDDIREDSVELNALLSDSEFSVDDEEASTGHSPSTMTDNGMHDPVEETEIGEEVDSLIGPTKRRKLLDGGYVPSNSHIANSLKNYMSSSLEDDAESHCGNGSMPCEEELELWSGNKRLRKERIHEILSILQSVIPNLNGKDTIVVIDEAIRYLKSLKVEAEALGINNI